ncbi:hypothetical protein [Falsiroseomonas sp. HW251]|uniref:hypothetical protein n=1 Tax=Falsiroseomonas sp. HW251 TaxID=3390998 RepID=UPI003D31CBB5
MPLGSMVEEHSRQRHCAPANSPSPNHARTEHYGYRGTDMRVIFAGRSPLSSVLSRLRLGQPWSILGNQALHLARGAAELLGVVPVQERHIVSNRRWRIATAMLMSLRYFEYKHLTRSVLPRRPAAAH